MMIRKCHLIRVKEVLNDESEIFYGPYKGRKLKDVPDEYLLLLHTRGTSDPDLMAYIEDCIQAIRNNVEINKQKGIKLRPEKE